MRIDSRDAPADFGAKDLICAVHSSLLSNPACSSIILLYQVLYALMPQSAIISVPISEDVGVWGLGGYVCVSSYDIILIVYTTDMARRTRNKVLQGTKMIAYRAMP